MRAADARAGAPAGTDNVRGALCILVSCVLFTAMAATAKFLGQRLPVVEVAFGRAFFGLLFILPLAVRAGAGAWRTSHPGLLVSRGLLGSTAMIASFYAVTHLPLADATALSFTKPLFQVVLAAVVLRELVRAYRWGATAIGFLGVLVMVGPNLGGGGFHHAILVALFAAVLSALVSITLRHLVRTERELTILLYLGVVGSLITGIPSLFVWVWPEPFELVLLIGMAGVGMISQLFLMRGFLLGEASAMAPFDYARLPMAAAWGFVLFAELPGWSTVMGALVIAGSAGYIARREARLARRPA